MIFDGVNIHPFELPCDIGMNDVDLLEAVVWDAVGRGADAVEWYRREWKPIR